MQLLRKLLAMMFPIINIVVETLCLLLVAYHVRLVPPMSMFKRADINTLQRKGHYNVVDKEQRNDSEFHSAAARQDCQKC
jgi:hypothetical protein